MFNLKNFEVWFYTCQNTTLLEITCRGSFSLFQGMASMSDYAIGFHYVSLEMCYLLDYAVYHLRPYGVHFVDKDLNVPVK